MERFLQFSATSSSMSPWIRVTPAAATSEGPKTSFKLLIAFLLILYTNLAIWYKELDELRPALVIAVAAIAMLLVELGQKRQGFRLSRPQGLLLLAFLAVCFISSFDAMYARLAFERTSDVLKIVLIYIVIENTVTTQARLRTFLMVMALGALFPAIGTIDHFIHGILKEGRAAWIGVFANANEDAYGLVIATPIAAVLSANARLSVRIALWGAMALYLMAIFFTYSRGGLLGLFAVLCLAGWKQKSPLIRSVMVAAVVLSLVLVSLYWGRREGFTGISQDTTYNQRIATMKAGIAMFEANPLFGVGPGCSIVAYPIYVPPEAHCGCQLQLVVHNTFVQALGEVGLLGFVPLMALIGISLFHAWKLQKGPLSQYGAALEIALWGFVVCSLSGGFTYTWWPYILIALVVAAKHIAASTPTAEPDAVV